MLNKEVLDLLIKKKLHISFAESVTGGACSAYLVKVPNCSNVLNESYVTYSIDSKIRILGVKEETIKDFGIVSEEVAKEMAIGVKKVSSSDIGVGLTGSAGPSTCGDDSVGLVCFGIAYKGFILSYQKQFMNQTREQVIDSAVAFVYQKLTEVLRNESI